MATDNNGPAVHIAVGVLMEQQSCDATHAIGLLIAWSSTTGRTVGDLAVEIIDDPRRIVVGS